MVTIIVGVTSIILSKQFNEDLDAFTWPGMFLEIKTNI